MAPLPDGFSYAEWNATYNALSFGIAAMGSATIFFWLQLPNVTKNYRTALTITGIVTLIATYHYIRIFNSWSEAFTVASKDGGDYTVKLTGAPFNDGYRYVDWLLTVPLLLIELILVMKLPQAETVSLSWKLGLASALMVALGYPGEIQEALRPPCMSRWATPLLMSWPRPCLACSFGPLRLRSLQWRRVASCCLTKSWGVAS
ncbi:unnamed protein product [Polarella glacialis]|uniref:Rhodopsin n=1 Tax=Polarella glacialis TaxID=89957 RepID=A0A813FRP4_POLGL|nr:unnamed protein product [Polarella glacialis]